MGLFCARWRMSCLYVIFLLLLLFVCLFWFGFFVFLSHKVDMTSRFWVHVLSLKSKGEKCSLMNPLYYFDNAHPLLSTDWQRQTVFWVTTSSGPLFQRWRTAFCWKGGLTSRPTWSESKPGRLCRKPWTLGRLVRQSNAESSSHHVRHHQRSCVLIFFFFGGGGIL